MAPADGGVDGGGFVQSAPGDGPVLGGHLIRLSSAYAGVPPTGGVAPSTADGGMRCRGCVGVVAPRPVVSAPGHRPVVVIDVVGIGLASAAADRRGDGACRYLVDSVSADQVGGLGDGVLLDPQAGEG